MREDERERVSRQGTEAWRRLKREKSWGDWLKVGEALQVGREWAMNQAGTNRPDGKGYNMAFGEWLTKYRLDDMDKGDRSRLFSVIDNLGPIEEWRRTLTLTERLKLNHPNAVWRKWKAAIEPAPSEGSAKPTIRDALVQSQEELAQKQQELVQLKAHIGELEAARATARAADLLLWSREPNVIAAEMVANLTPGRIIEVFNLVRAQIAKPKQRKGKRRRNTPDDNKH
jgi:hypothetical protein